MKNLPILKYFRDMLLHGVMYVLGVVLFPIYFPFRKKKVPFLWWFINDDEKDYVSNTYGDDAYRVRRGFNYDTASNLRKLYEAFIWIAIRNSHWNFRIHIYKPKTGTPYDIDVIHNNTTPETSGMTFCNYNIHGKQFAKYTVDGERYFRYSFTRPFFEGMINLHSGWAEGRWILKLRIFKKK